MTIPQKQTRQSVNRAGARIRYTLEFYVWGGASYSWVDYTDRLVALGPVNLSVEERAFPNSFRLTMSAIELDNRDGLFNAIDTLDGALANTSEPYGKRLYKRRVRISEVWSQVGETGVAQYTTTVLFVGIVRDVQIAPDKSTVNIRLMSLDGVAMDQMTDEEKAERHPLGSNDADTPSEWLATQPSAATDTVPLYRYRERESDSDTFLYQWFRNRRIYDILERVSWALDDLGYSIEEATFFSSDGRSLASTRNVPPDDSTVSTGAGDMRTRVLMWNIERSCLVCCVGHKVYDYDPTTNVYTLRNTLTSSRQIVWGAYCNQADSGGKNKRLVLVLYDVDAYIGTTTTAYLCVLDASGTGAYGVLQSETSLGADIFPATHQVRPGRENGASPDYHSGQIDGIECGENMNNMFRQYIRADFTGVGSPSSAAQHQDDNADVDDIWDNKVTGSTRTLPYIFNRGYFAVKTPSTGETGEAHNVRWSWGTRPAFCIMIGNSASDCRLWFFTWDATNGYRLKQYNLYNYSAGSYVSEPSGSSNTWCPVMMYADGTNNYLVHVSMMAWDETAGAPNPSECKYYKWSNSSTTWSQVTFLSGATGDNVYWTVLNVTRLASFHPAILYNRKTTEFTFTSDLATSWSGTDGGRELTTTNRLEGLFSFTNPTTDLALFVENHHSAGQLTGGSMLWSWNQTALIEANTTLGGQPYPINTDLGLSSNMCQTGTNYPTSSTPDGVVFGVTANDFGDYNEAPLAGEYTLFQWSNFYAGFVKLLDLSGLSFHELRSLLAEIIGYVHYYRRDGTWIFKPRDRTADTAVVTFSPDNRNYVTAGIESQGWERIINEIIVKPFEVAVEAQVSDILAGNTGGPNLGLLEDVDVAGDPGERAQWKVLFTSTTTYNIYKWEGTPPTWVSKATGKSINNIVRGSEITDGAYLTFHPYHFSGTFAAGDNFSFWVYEPERSLVMHDYRNRVVAVDSDSVAAYRRISSEFENRFADKHLAGDYARAILDYRKDAHQIVRLEAIADPTIQPLDVVAIVDDALGFVGTEKFFVASIAYRDRPTMTLEVVRL